MKNLGSFATCKLPALAIAALISWHATVSAHPGAHEPQVAEQVAGAAAEMDAFTPVGTVLAFHHALRQGNTAAALNLLAEDVLIYESGGVERSRAEYASHHLGSDAAFSAAVPRTLVDRTTREAGDVALGDQCRNRDRNLSRSGDQ